MCAEPRELDKLDDSLAVEVSTWAPQLAAAIECFRSAAAELESLIATGMQALADTAEMQAMAQGEADVRLGEIAALSHLLLQPNEGPRAGTGPDAQRKLDERTREIVKLSRLLQEHERTARKAEESLSWLRDVYRVLFLCPRWWGFMPRRWRERKQAALLHRKGLFDTQGYLDRYPDVVLDGINPVRHYILSGQVEGRLR